MQRIAATHTAHLGVLAHDGLGDDRDFALNHNEHAIPSFALQRSGINTPLQEHTALSRCGSSLSHLNTDVLPGTKLHEAAAVQELLSIIIAQLCSVSRRSDHSQTLSNDCTRPVRT